MITLALDTATDRCTVAASNDGHIAERHMDGARQHATSILGLVDAVLVEVGAAPSDITRVVLADGPGSFTGLRVAAAVAKAIAWRRSVDLLVAPSLLVRAAPHAPAGGGVVLALSDALRGELYAGCWTITVEGITAHSGYPRAMRPAELAAFGAVQAVVGSVPPALLGEVEAVTRCSVSGAALPDARTLIALAALRGGTVAVADIDGWEPTYGRPAEAQAVWERRHGRPLPTPASLPH